MIKVENLTKKFGSVKAVDNLSFEIHSGEVLGFLGPNGAGKTTTMRMLTGFLSSDKGKILIDGVDIEKDSIAAQKKIGYLPENNPLYKNMQVAEFLDLAASLHQIAAEKKAEAFEFVVKAVGIEKVFHRPIGELSKGYKQRVGIAAALIHKPQIIIMDEPTEGLDPNQRAEIRQLIKDLAKEHTIILSTHVMQEASAVCSRLLIISQGKLVADGTADDLSRLSQKEKVLNFELEGREIEARLSVLAHLKKLEVTKKENERIEGKLILEEGHTAQKDIAKLTWENHWIVWNLHEEEQKLEEIFQVLTKS
ncbi:MAG: ATP-binding cassette domain-containing protein [Parcubacteria group bacterium]|jgi:ABC-2 type transport system ATP-binding protein